MLTFRNFIVESEENKLFLEDERFGDYLVYLSEAHLSLLSEAQLSLNVINPHGNNQQVSWGSVKQGFDQASNRQQRRNLAREARKIRPQKLLGAEGSNPKLAKEGENVPEYATKGLSLTPSDESGRINTCSCATEECRAACLNKAGRGAMTFTQKARLARTNFMLDHPHHFMSMLHDEIDTHEKSATKKGKKAAVRLNIVSDIPWEKLHPEVFSQHPNTQFYDYTKIAGRVLNPDGSKKQLPSNYHLTFSSTGIHDHGNWDDARKHLDNGGVVAMVFKVPAARGGKKGGDLPTHVVDQKTGKKYRVIDGDLHDHRHLDHVYNDASPDEGLIAGLRIKGGRKMAEKAGDFAVSTTPGQDHVVVPDIQRKKK